MVYTRPATHPCRADPRLVSVLARGSIVTTTTTTTTTTNNNNNNSQCLGEEAGRSSFRVYGLPANAINKPSGEARRSDLKGHAAMSQTTTSTHPSQDDPRPLSVSPKKSMTANNSSRNQPLAEQAQRYNFLTYERPANVHNQRDR